MSHRLFTIGYEGATPEAFLDALRHARVTLLADVRAVARSRRPGFAKTRLSASLREAGISYVHVPSLGTPAEGRAAARAGRHVVMKSVYSMHILTPGAQEGLVQIVGMIEAGETVCLMCLEARPEHCHRTLVAEAVRLMIDVRVIDLDVLADGDADELACR